MQKRVVTREMPLLTRQAAVVPESLDAESRTFELVWTTGAQVRRYSWWRDEWYFEELSLEDGHVRMERLQNGAPLLNAHKDFELGDVMGVVEDAQIENSERGVATVRFPEEGIDEEADRVFRKVAGGIIRQVSVGYRAYKFERTDEEGKLPILRATDWEPFELSLVPVGADADAQVRSRGADTNPCEFVLDEERSMPKEKSAPKPVTPTPSPAPEPRSPDEATLRAQGAEAERTRQAEIRAAGTHLELDDEFVQRHLDEGTDIGAFRTAAIDAVAAKRSPNKPKPGGSPNIDPGEDNRDKWLRGATDWLLQRAHVAGDVIAAAKKRGETLVIDPGEFRGMTLVELSRQSLERRGVRTAGMDRMRLVGEALTHRAAGYNSTSDFAVLLENVMHKTLLAAYGITPDTWSRFSKRGSVSDFRAHNRYRQGTFGALDTVLEGAEYTSKDVPDGRKESITAATKGNLVSITRQAIINDDMDAFSTIATGMGRAARLSIEKDVYALLAENAGLGPAMVSDGLTLFHANHSNIGAGAALSVASIDADRVIMAQQTDESGNEFLDLRPSILVLPVGLGGDARVINDAQYDNDGTEFEKPNKVRGLYSDIVDTPRMSGTRRYSFADANIAPVVEVAFLDGQEQPFLDRKDGWNMDGVEWKVRLDYGVGAIDFRGAVTNAGA